VRTFPTPVEIGIFPGCGLSELAKNFTAKVIENASLIFLSHLSVIEATFQWPKFNHHFIVMLLPPYLKNGIDV
jgi:hypothetical protein